MGQQFRVLPEAERGGRGDLVIEVEDGDVLDPGEEGVGAEEDVGRVRLQEKQISLELYLLHISCSCSKINMNGQRGCELSGITGIGRTGLAEANVRTNQNDVCWFMEVCISRGVTFDFREGRR